MTRQFDDDFSDSPASQPARRAQALPEADPLPHPLYEDAPEPAKAKRDAAPATVQERPRPMIDPITLARALGYSEQDLAYNQRGEASPKQVQALQGDLKDEADSMWLMLQMGLGVLAVLGVIFVLEGAPVQYLVIGAALYLGAMFAYGLRRQTRRKRDAFSVAIKQVEGVPSFAGAFDPEQPARLIIDKVRLRLSREQAIQLFEYQIPPLRVYYTEGNEAILSAEILAPSWGEKTKNDLLDL